VLCNYYSYYYFHSTAIFPGEPGSSSSPCVLLLHLFLKRTSENWWNKFFMGWVSFLPSSCQSQSTEGNKKHLTSGLASYFLHPPPDSWWKVCCFLCISSPIPVPLVVLHKRSYIYEVWLSCSRLNSGSRVGGKSAETESRTDGARISKDNIKCRLSGTSSSEF